MKSFLENLKQNYTKIYQEGFGQRRITHEILEKHLKTLQKHKRLELEKVGESVEGRDIYRVKIGNGGIKVLFWSQMHGNESTATRALLDIFNFFTADDLFEDEIKKITDKLQLIFIPMLNPDGAEIYSRENAFGLDMNRDALALIAPESQLLNRIVSGSNPDFAFNLHDQVRYYTVGRTGSSAALSFLAPPVDEMNSYPPHRKRAMQIICAMNEVIQEFLPGQVGRYSDEFESRAFGEAAQTSGISTILIESGGLLGDDQREFVRQMNVFSMLSVLKRIADNSYLEIEFEDYFNIPENTKFLMDLIVRSGDIMVAGKRWPVDIGVMREEFYDGSNIAFKGTIEAVGDLSIFNGYEEIDAHGLTIEPGKIFQSENLENAAKMIKELMNQKFTGINIKGFQDRGISPVPLNIHLDSTDNNELKPGRPANFVISDKTGVRWLIVNGFPINPLSGDELFKNALIV